ncbi:MAG: hypothetical protein R2697_00705 [Ilumatobacteraceae bacterium]
MPSEVERGHAQPERDRSGHDLDGCVGELEFAPSTTTDAPTVAGIAYSLLSAEKIWGTSPASTSRSRPPPIAEIAPTSTAAGMLTGASTARDAPTAANKPRPAASNTSTG